jgi:transposase
LQEQESEIKEKLHSTELALSKDERTAMEQFYKRYNKAMLDSLSFEAQKRMLQEENDNLRLILKQYLDGISVSEEVLSHSNPLFIINGKTNAP